MKNSEEIEIPKCGLAKLSHEDLKILHNSKIGNEIKVVIKKNYQQRKAQDLMDSFQILQKLQGKI